MVRERDSYLAHPAAPVDELLARVRQTPDRAGKTSKQKRPPESKAAATRATTTDVAGLHL